MTSQLYDTASEYFQYFPYFLVACLIAFILTPIVGFFARKIGLVDLPNRLRKGSEKLPQRMHKKILARGGGLAVLIPFILIALIAVPMNKQLIGLFLGVVILILIGILDEKYEISGKWQFLGQVLAALIIVVTGTSIDAINNPVNGEFNLRIWEIPLFHLNSQQLFLALPADIITICWILIMINAVGWVFGVDALGEGIMIITFLTITLTSVKVGTPVTAVLSILLAGGILGFIPYNFPPSKIMSGATGAPVYGFLIAVLSIISGAKVATSVLILLIPLVDMVWVMVGRIRREKITNIMKLLSVSDRTHLHHRLLDLGLSGKQVLLVEYCGVALSAVFGYYFGNLPKVALIAFFIFIILVFFLLVSSLLKRGIKIKGEKKAKSEKTEPPPEPPVETESPESKYAY